jgi:hypothetical protein
MGRLRRFDQNRYIGARDTMRFYDCDDEGQFEELQYRVETDDLLDRDLLSSFAPDEPSEARNRGFRAAVGQPRR